MGKRGWMRVVWSAVLLFFILTLAGNGVKLKNEGRVAPGIRVWGMELAGRTYEEALELLIEKMPEVKVEIVCPGAGKGGTDYRLVTEEAFFEIDTKKTTENLQKAGTSVSLWEWIYYSITGKSAEKRTCGVELSEKEGYFPKLLQTCAREICREAKDAAVTWTEKGLTVTESQTGYGLDVGQTMRDAQALSEQVKHKLRENGAEGLVVRLAVKGAAIKPRLTTEQARSCNTKLAEFSTFYAGAGAGRAQNIAVGAKHLQGKVILPGEEFSVAAALMPFTEENGYAAGGTFIDGRLSESIGGGVCQLSTTLYNALLHTRLEIVERYPHSMPVGYVPLGQDAAIAGDYKDLRFRNTTDAPVVILCEATGEKVTVTLYGEAVAARTGLQIESVVKEENEESITVEVYATELRDGVKVRKLLSVNQYEKEIELR